MQNFKLDMQTKNSYIKIAYQIINQNLIRTNYIPTILDMQPL